MGSQFRITAQRGKFFPHPWAKELVATVHPSAILRVPERYDEEYELFLSDLRTIASRVSELDRARTRSA
jgi:DNA polymerase